MPNARAANAVRLEFAPGALVHANLSGAAFSGDWLWVVGDEACGVDRLRRLDPVGSETFRFGEGCDFPLKDLLDLPGAADEEADVTLTADRATFEGLLSGDVNPTMAFMTGKLKVDGSMGTAMKLGALLS